MPDDLSQIFQKAARYTGVSADYLAATANRESSFRVGVKAKTSSAAGLFQFIEQTWLRLMIQDGNCFGLERYVRHIKRAPNGRLYVASPGWRRKILALRLRPVAATIMAGRLTHRNAHSFRVHMHRAPTYAELYVAHFLGPQKAARMSMALKYRPNMRADALFPRAAKSNPRIFYKRGYARPVVAVFAELTRMHSNVRVSFHRRPESWVASLWQ